MNNPTPRATGECQRCKGPMYHDGMNWRHQANDRTLQYCPEPNPTTAPQALSPEDAGKIAQEAVQAAVSVIRRRLVECQDEAKRRMLATGTGTERYFAGRDDGLRDALAILTEVERSAEIAILGDPRRHPFATNGSPVEACLKCGRQQDRYQATEEEL